MTAVRHKADPSPDKVASHDEVPSTPAGQTVVDKPSSSATSQAGTNALQSSTMLALATLVLLVAIPYFHPSLQRFRLLSPLTEGQGFVAVAPGAAPAPSVGEAPLVVETIEQSALKQPEEVTLPAAAAEIVEPAAGAKVDKPPRSIEDPSGHALDAFFKHLRAVERKEPRSIARITYFGDSIVASDWITTTVRRKFQKRFGDAGHGFMLMANAWPGYFHNDVERFSAPGWKVSRVVGPYAPDGLYGLGGVSFKAWGKGAFSRFATAKEGSFGRNVSRFVVHWLAHEDGGPMIISVDGVPRETITTQSPTSISKFSTYEVSDGPHGIEVRADGAGVRAFGVVMERDVPGVVLDAIGIQGCRIRFLDKSDDVHFAEQLRARDPSLTVFQYGMNESEDGEIFPLDQYESTMRDVLKQVRTALPNSSCLLVGPMDRADKKANGYTSRPVVPKLAAIQRKVATEVGCAYWDTLSAMGGFGSMGIWVQRGLGGADLAHPSGTGADVLGRWIYMALMESYANYVSHEPR